MSHTPGPWAAERTLDVGWTVDSVPLRQGYGRVVVADVDSTVDDEETAANARLICAAPDLLATIEAFLEADKDREFADTVDLDEYAMEWANALNALKAAVAKARGAS